MFARGLGEPVDRLGDLGSADEEALDRPNLAALRAREGEIGFVGIDDAAVILDHHEPVARRVGHQLGDVVAGVWPENWTTPIAMAKRKNTPAMAKKARSPRIRGWACSMPRKRRLRVAPTRSAGQQQHPSDMAGTVGAVDRPNPWRVALVSHEISTSSTEANVPHGTGCKIAANRSIFSDHITR